MNFIADEGVDAPIVVSLRQESHNVWYVAEMAPGVSDSVILDLANQKGALLLTSDKDFGDLIFRQHRISQGVILLRLHGLAADQKAELVVAAIRAHGSQMVQAFTVITHQKVRVRRHLH